MNKLIKVVLFLMIFTIPTVIYAKEKQGFTELICMEIKRNFIECHQNIEIASEVMEPFINAKKYKDLYNKDFLLTSIYENQFGGIWAIIGFSNIKDSYRLWLYEIDKSQWQIRLIEKEEVKCPVASCG